MKIVNFARVCVLLAMLILKNLPPLHGQNIVGTTNLEAYFDEVPTLPQSPAEAARRTDDFFKNYEQKVNRRLEEFQNYLRQKMEPGAANEADFHSEATAAVNSNPIVAGMGGYEKVVKMDKNEARTAALEASRQQMADPFGGQSAGMTALYQKIIADPAFAAKFEKMSDSEREAELRKFMANDRPQTKTPAQLEEQQLKKEQEQTKSSETKNAMEIQMKIGEWAQQLSAVSLDFHAKLDAVKNLNPPTHAEISADFWKKYEQIPTVALGEMREKDPAIEQPLRLETARLHRERAHFELKQNAVLLAEMTAMYKSVATEYLDFVGKNGYKIYGGTSAQDMILNKNTELPLVQFEGELLNFGLEICHRTKNLTFEAAQFEKTFLEAGGR